jgi:LacI family transcriptional regulator
VDLAILAILARILLSLDTLADILRVVPRKPSSNVNLAAIAKRLGISISTASRALRNAEGIRAETRTRVLQAAETLGYDFSRRNALEISPHPHHIMALAQCSSPQTDQRYLAGMSRASVMLNLAILSHHITTEECPRVLDPRHQPPAMRAGLVEGLVLIHRWPSEIAQRLSEKWPMVSIVHHYPDTTIDHIGIDDRTGMAALMSHLQSGGHKRIGFFGLCREMSWACSRFSAYVERLVRMGFAYEPQNVIEISLEEALATVTFECGPWTERAISRTKAGVDAWVCSSTATAHTLCRCFRDRGYRIPEDVAVTGYHSSKINPADLPLLTSTEVADEELGAAALRRLLHRFSHPDESQRSVLLPARFMEGETTRKVSSRAAA